uniref:WAT1-related protein n=1 Tax=Araucaria cunninghamii TaxID=56994 RepID=A0A0D6QTB5_ARACU
MEDFGPYLAQMILQFSYAGMNVLVKLALENGLNHFVLVTYRLAVAAVAISPFAYVLERKQRPSLTWPLFFQIFLVACGLSVSQNCYFQGIYYTSSTFASAAINLIPIITFVMATFIRLERIDIKTVRGQAKLVGTIICVSGAMVMTFYQGPTIWKSSSSPVDRKSTRPNSSEPPHTNMAWGSVLIFGGIIAWSAWLTFQGPVLKRYPSQLSFTALMCIFGSVQSGLSGIVVEHNNLDIWAIRWNIQLLTILYTGIVCSALAFFVQAWCIQKKGPVFAGVFSPLCTITTALLEFAILHVSLHLGSVVGAILIIMGLYFALWGKAKDQVKTSEVSTPPEENSKEVKESENQHSGEQDNNV